MIFTDRRDAGRALARELAWLSGERPLVLALPRGGVPVGFEVAHALGVPLDIFIVRKLGVPGHEELAMGAIASGGAVVFNRQLVQHLGVSSTHLREVVHREGRELARRERLYRGGRHPPEVRGRTAVLVDDGLATGSTMRAALKALRSLGPARTIVGVPVGAVEACRDLSGEADQVVCVATPDPFQAVGLWYGDFSETPDAEVIELLRLGCPVEARV
jgi:predicted phosphoribosyltransferase